MNVNWMILVKVQMSTASTPEVVMSVLRLLVRSITNVTNTKRGFSILNCIQHNLKLICLYLLFSRCKIDTDLCRYNECSQHLPDQISYHFFNIVSNYTILDEPVKLFKMRGPQSPHSRVAFKLDVQTARFPLFVRPANENDFLLDRQHNSVTISIKTSIEGPQQVELTLQMQIFNHNVLTNTVISKIILYVSQYKF